MITLAKHIETLLLDNDCVVVPEFGGFIAHYKPAYFDEKSSTFFPPQRIIGFNPKLVMNDGLLVQSYMQALDTDFSDANQNIENEVEDLKNQLYRDGFVSLLNIGRITCLADGSLNFVPSDKTIDTPNLYGLSDFQLEKISSDRKGHNNKSKALPDSTYSSSSSANRHVVANSFIGSALGVAVALFLFFFLSVPVENNHVENEDYAFLGDAGLFNSIKAKSFVATVFDLPATVEKTPEVKNNRKVLNNDVKTTVVAENHDSAELSKNEDNTPKEIVSPTPDNVEPVKVAEKRYHIIVSSTTSEQEAKDLVNKLHSKGFEDATIIDGKGLYKYRVSICNLKDESSAYNKLNQLVASNETITDAWVLCSK